MKDNKIHKILEIITAQGTEGQESYRYDWLPDKVGFNEFAIRGYCDILETDGLLIQRQHEGYFTRNYDKCRKAYEIGQYKEDELNKRTILGMSYEVAGIIGGFAGGGLLVPGIITYINDRRVERAEEQHQKDIKRIERLVLLNDSLLYILNKTNSPERDSIKPIQDDSSKQR